MNTLLTRSFVLFSLFTITTACTADNVLSSISITKGKYKDYYHLPYVLKQDSFVFSKDESGKNYNDYTAEELTSNGGQFELLVPVSQFPIPAPNCHSNIIIRMPWTNPEPQNAATSIVVKIELFNKLQQLKMGNASPVKIILELNPYVKAVSTTPLALQLTECNVFFRHANGRYIDAIGKLTH